MAASVLPDDLAPGSKLLVERQGRFTELKEIA